MTWSATRAVRRRANLILAFVVLCLSTCSLPASRHPAVGRWRVANFEIVVDPENWASLNGVPCEWRAVDWDTITVTPRKTFWSPELNTRIRSTFTFETVQDGRYAVVDILKYPLALEPAGRGANREGQRRTSYE